MIHSMNNPALRAVKKGRRIMSNMNEYLGERYATRVFNDNAMRKYLPGDTYKQLKKTIDRGRPLEPELADIVANGLKRWALDQGATHYTHWFQPMTGATAEKHDSFINPQSDGSVIMSFSGKELVRGESDASSFPSGGLRVTFEARGYTAWDCTSPAFVKENTLCIPTCFCSFTGEVLDKKTPLLRSMEAVSYHAMRLVNIFGGNDVGRVVSMAGAEQEYFLVDRSLYAKRPDLIMCGRTLFGAKPPKSQELDDHYYGNIKDRVMAYMREVDEELWQLGVPAKTEHNEVAPGQHELASVYTTANIATDQNQLVMETLKKVALRHDLVCLLHEKPFDRVNGSGKHNNWSLQLENGKSLMDQGKTPESSARFLMILAAVIWAVDEYAELLRVSVSSAGNDCRLGGNEAPPSVISIFLGDLLTDVLGEIAHGGASDIRQGGNLKIGVTTIPNLPRDISDRNRTSPFAFTGKKFEFRMVGSSMSIADCNTVINTIVAETLSRICDRLEQAADVNEESRAIIREIMQNHQKVVFNGNNYSEQWRKEAQSRGLPNLPTAVDAAKALLMDKNVSVMERHGVLNRKELEARYEIRLENYVKTVCIEADVMIDMVACQFIPAAIKYIHHLADCINAVKATGLSVDLAVEAGLLKDVSAQTTRLQAALSKLEKISEKGEGMTDHVAQAEYYRDKVVPAMAALRGCTDTLERLMGKEYWPVPTYADLMFGIL